MGNGFFIIVLWGPLQAHKPLRRLPSDMPSGKRRRRRVTGKQRDKNFVEKKAEPQHEKTCDAPDEQEQQTDDASNHSSSSSSSSSTTTSPEADNETDNKPDNEPDNEPDTQSADKEPNEPSPQVQAKSSSSSSSNLQHGVSDLWMI